MSKIVIDIDEYDYEWIKNAYAISNEINIKIAESIINGIPLNDIKTEIRERKFKGYINESGRTDLPDHQANFNSGLICALRIIDKHTKRNK